MFADSLTFVYWSHHPISDRYAN